MINGFTFRKWSASLAPIALFFQCFDKEMTSSKNDILCVFLFFFIWGWGFYNITRADYSMSMKEQRYTMRPKFGSIQFEPVSQFRCPLWLVSCCWGSLDQRKLHDWCWSSIEVRKKSTIRVSWKKYYWVSPRNKVLLLFAVAGFLGGQCCGWSLYAPQLLSVLYKGLLFYCKSWKNWYKLL